MSGAGACARARGLMASSRGQMVVELAACVPVCIVVALVAFNLVRFMGACAEFDRVAMDAVIAHGVAPAGTSSAQGAAAEVRSCIEDALDMGRVEVDVTAESAWEAAASSGASLPLQPLLTRFTCTMRYRPWPGALTIAGVRFSPPALLEHKKELVVDRFRSGVVV